MEVKANSFFFCNTENELVWVFEMVIIFLCLQNSIQQQQQKSRELIFATTEFSIYFCSGYAEKAGTKYSRKMRKKRRKKSILFWLVGTECCVLARVYCCYSSIRLVNMKRAQFHCKQISRTAMEKASPCAPQNRKCTYKYMKFCSI